MTELIYTKPLEQDENHENHRCVGKSTQSIIWIAQQIEELFDLRKLNCEPLNKELMDIESSLGYLLDAIESELPS